MFEKITDKKPNEDGDYAITVVISKSELEDFVSKQIYEKVPSLVIKEMGNFGIPTKQVEAQELFSSLKNVKRNSGLIVDKILNWFVGFLIGALILYITWGIKK